MEPTTPKQQLLTEEEQKQAQPATSLPVQWVPNTYVQGVPAGTIPQTVPIIPNGNAGSAGGVIYAQYPAQIPPGSQIIIVTPDGQQSGVTWAPYPPGAPGQLYQPGRIADARLPHDTNQAYCAPHCMSRLLCLGGVFLAVITLFGVLSAFSGVFLPFLAIAPAAVILSFVGHEYRASVTKCQMVSTFMEAVLWMIPLSLILLLYLDFVSNHLNLPQSGLCPECVAGYALQAFVLAGFLEEMLKYTTVQRLYYEAFIVDPRAFIVYGTCAAAGFATVENILYVVTGNLFVGIARAITSVPLHCATGMLMGCLLAEKRFFNKNYKWYQIVFFPIIIHGTYDFILFLTSYGSGQSWAVWLGLLMALIIVLSTYLVIRRLVQKIQNNFAPLDLHIKIQNGEVPIPVGCCVNVCPRNIMV